MLLYVEERFTGSKLTFNQWLTLKSVNDGSVRTAGEVARLLAITSGAATRLLDALEARQVLRREHCEIDRRVVKVFVTPAGVNEVVGAAPILTAAWNEILSGIDEAEFATFTKVATQLLAAFEQPRKTDDTGPNAKQGAPFRGRMKRRRNLPTAPGSSRSRPLSVPARDGSA